MVCSAGWQLWTLGAWQSWATAVRIVVWACWKRFQMRLGSGVAHAAVETPQGVQFIAALGGACQEGPEAFGGEAQASNFVGGPNAEGTSAAGSALAVIAKDTTSADGAVQVVVFIVAAQEAMADEGSDALAVWTWSLLKVDVLEVCLRFVKPLNHRSVCFGKTYDDSGQGSDFEASMRQKVKIGGVCGV